MRPGRGLYDPMKLFVDEVKLTMLEALHRLFIEDSGRGLNNVEIADKHHVPAGYVGKILRRDTDGIGFEKVYILCLAAGIEVKLHTGELFTNVKIDGRVQVDEGRSPRYVHHFGSGGRSTRRSGSSRLPQY